MVLPTGALKYGFCDIKSSQQEASKTSALAIRCLPTVLRPGTQLIPGHDLVYVLRVLPTPVPREINSPSTVPRYAYPKCTTSSRNLNLANFSTRPVPHTPTVLHGACYRRSTIPSCCFCSVTNAPVFPSHPIPSHPIPCMPPSTSLT